MNCLIVVKIFEDVISVDHFCSYFIRIMSTATNVQPGKEVLEAEVSPEILQQFEILK